MHKKNKFKVDIKVEIMYEKRIKIPDLMVFATIPEETIFIYPCWTKNGKEYEVRVSHQRSDATRIIESVASFPRKKQAIKYCYEHYLMDKLSGFYVRWLGPDPKEFLEEE